MRAEGRRGGAFSRCFPQNPLPDSKAVERLGSQCCRSRARGCSALPSPRRRLTGRGWGGSRGAAQERASRPGHREGAGALWDGAARRRRRLLTSCRAEGGSGRGRRCRGAGGEKDIPAPGAGRRRAGGGGDARTRCARRGLGGRHAADAGTNRLPLYLSTRHTTLGRARTTASCSPPLNQPQPPCQSTPGAHALPFCCPARCPARPSSLRDRVSLNSVTRAPCRPAASTSPLAPPSAAGAQASTPCCRSATSTRSARRSSWGLSCRCAPRRGGRGLAEGL